jgi:nucleoside-diphosphate-sugar epimerase
VTLRISVTGANGFVGRQVVLAAVAEGHEAVGIVRSEEAARVVADAGGVPARVPALESEALTRAVAGSAALVHLVGIGSERPGLTYDAVNVGGMQAALAAARAAGVPRVVYLSGLGVAHYGMTRRCTNPYFLSKLAAEVELFRSGLQAVAFRPSYILGPGGELVTDLLKELAAGSVEQIEDGAYRMQPLSVRDAAAAIVAACTKPLARAAVFDLVGPEPIGYRDLILRLARLAGRTGAYSVRSVPVQEADRQAASGGYRGMGPDSLDCLLCDETADPRPLEALLGRFLTPLDDVLALAARGAR